MKISSRALLKACTLSVALLGSAAIVTAISMPDAAFAKSGNDNGGGNGNGNGGGNGGGKGNGNGGSAKSSGGSVEKSGGAKSEKSSASKTKTKTKTKSASKKKAILDDLGLSASDLGALNAARANPNALKNASPNSRVGKIAAFREAVLAGQELEADLAEKTAILESLTPPDRPSTDINTELQAAISDADAKAGTVSQLEQVLAEATANGEDTTGIEAELATAKDDLAAAEAAEAELQDEYDAAVEYETVSAEVDELTEQVAAQPEVERDLLEAASNKPVTDAVDAAVRKLLGL